MSHAVQLVLRPSRISRARRLRVTLQRVNPWRFASRSAPVRAARATTRRVVLAVGWTIVAALIAIGAAGVVAATEHPAGTNARPELTWAGDQAAVPALDTASDELARLSDAVDTLASTARGSLTEIVGGDVQALSDTIDTGTAQVTDVKTQTAQLTAALERVPGVGDGSALRLSPGVIDRYAALASTQGLTDGLETDWLAFTGRAVEAARLTNLLTRHDQQTAAAAKAGAAGHYQRALTLLDAPDATLAEAVRLRDDLAGTTDVSTLTEWLNRNATYDAALRNLYQSLVDARGRVTNRVRKAFADEATARDQLPADTRGLVVIMGDVARGGLNQAVISIEQARGALAAALDVQQQYQDLGTPSP